MEGEEPRLPGLDMDHKQLFFLNFAQVSQNNFKVYQLTGVWVEESAEDFWWLTFKQVYNLVM